MPTRNDDPPEDLTLERNSLVSDQIIELLQEHVGDQSVIDSIAQLIIDYALKLESTAYSEGYSQGVSDNAEAQAARPNAHSEGSPSE